MAAMDLGVLIKLVGGLAVLVAGLSQVRKVPRLRRDRVRTVGRVAGAERFEGEDGPLYAPVVTFDDEQGTRHKFTAELGTAGGVMHSAGEEVPVTYPPGHPEDARLSTPMQNALLIGLPLGLGLLFILVGLGLLGSLALSQW
jgi:hypothetical protein